ncbi:MAG: SAM-dependent methyltransferase, partial [Alphaproteobacteria bacterium]|nr:SAM-dependent methyltransferase [Alphaproteobacteria bacterium]
DDSAFAREWLVNARPPRGAAGPSLRTLMGGDFPEMIANLAANFANGRVGAVQAVLRRTA